jgi:threonine synthase
VPKAVGDFLILRAVRESGGFAMAVSDEELMRGVEDAARDDGFLLCPEGGATLAAWRKAVEAGLVSSGDTALLFNCATGLKYPMPDRSSVLDRHSRIDFAAL